jgi:hypothetical protein
MSIIIASLSGSRLKGYEHKAAISNERANTGDNQPVDHWTELRIPRIDMQTDKQQHFSDDTNGSDRGQESQWPIS